MAAVLAPQHPGIWHRHPQNDLHMSDMSMSNLLPSIPLYDSSRTAPNPPTPRSYQTATSHMEMHMPVFSTHAMTTTVPYQPGAFAFDAAPVNPYNMQQAFNMSYPPSIPQPVSYPGTSNMQSLPPVRDARNAFVMDRSSPVKSENSSPVQSNQAFNSTYGGQTKQDSSSTGTGVNFSTDVDTLMKAIQAKQKSVPAAPEAASSKTEDIKADHKSKKRYRCEIGNCDKTFHQKTHLDIHIRSHTGQKPFRCDIPGCDKGFSQLGNLKTHRRRHTGEKPFSCDVCGKTFAQRGNVRAHKTVHAKDKPFTCELDGDNGQTCGKQFTQLGNLKNKFHAHAIRYLTQKFACIDLGDYVSDHDRKLWEYFASLYKNSNKGIKGRGKDRRISVNPASTASNSASYTSSATHHLGRNYAGSYHHSSSERSSRSSSMTSESTMRADNSYDFNGPMHQQGYASNGYEVDMVFPERKMYS